MRDVDGWVQFMKEKEIQRVVCLLGKKPSGEEELDYYCHVPGGLIEAYKRAFGEDKVIHEPIDDYTLCEPQRLERIVAFLDNAKEAGDKVVVHCSGGSGRTGHVLACWLVHDRGLDPDAALRAVEQTGRCPREAGDGEKLRTLLEGCRKLPKSRSGEIG